MPFEWLGFKFTHPLNTRAKTLWGLTQKARDDAYHRLSRQDNHVTRPSTVPVVQFPQNMLNTVTIPPKAIAGKKRKRGGKKRFNLLGLPNETLLNIFTHLDAYESAVLALACKRLALIATTYSQLECRSNSFRWWRPYREGHFLKKKVGDKYFGEDMGYCYNCKHYCPREKDYWKLVVEHQGEQKRWVQYIDVLVERWLADGDTQWPLENWENGVGKRWCPRCLIYKDKVLNVEYAYGTGRD